MILTGRKDKHLKCFNLLTSIQISDTEQELILTVVTKCAAERNMDFLIMRLTKLEDQVVMDVMCQRMFLLKWVSQLISTSSLMWYSGLETSYLMTKITIPLNMQYHTKKDQLTIYKLTFLTMPSIQSRETTTLVNLIAKILAYQIQF